MEKIIVSRCMECSCIYACNSLTEKGVHRTVCLKCPRMHDCVHRLVIMSPEKLLKDKRDCETCSNRSVCVCWPSGSKKNCDICENRHRCRYKWMTSIADESVVVSHGYCTDECRVLGNSNMFFDENVIRRILSDCSKQDVEELLSFLESINEVYAFLPLEIKNVLKEEMVIVRREIILKMLAKAKRSPLRLVGVRMF